jgi:hypothetical protein
MTKLEFTYAWDKEPEIRDAIKSLESNCYLRDKIIAEAAMKATLRKQDEENERLLFQEFDRFHAGI